jgi:DNA-binding transcriptional LysR family regulator
MDRMIEIATFVKAVEAGGFAAASRKLNMFPSSVTVHIQDLKQRLGARLLNRSTRKISLIEVGKAYYERCLQILADVDEADNVVQALQSTPRGTLRLNVSIGIPQLLPPVIAEFTSLYPDVHLNVIMTDRMVNMIEEESTWRSGFCRYRTRASLCAASGLFACRFLERPAISRPTDFRGSPAISRSTIV